MAPIRASALVIFELNEIQETIFKKIWAFQWFCGIQLVSYS